MTLVFGPPRKLVVLAPLASDWPFPLAVGSSRRPCRVCGRDVWVHPSASIEVALVGATCQECAPAEAETTADKKSVQATISGWYERWKRERPEVR